MSSLGESGRPSDNSRAGARTPVTPVEPIATPLGTLHDGRPADASSEPTLLPGQPAAPAPAPPAPRGLIATHVGDLEATPSHARPLTGSTILPADTAYQLVRRLGSGAFGEVFEALAPGGVPVAIKRITRTVDHPASKSEHEALEAIKRLSHPYLLDISAYWVFDDRLVIVMQLADNSLSDRVEFHRSQGRLGVPPEELVPLFEQAAEALDYLHSQNVSHRDVKPENILILRGYAKVADFGLARLHEHAQTVVQNTVGTPAYMAPEMWKHQVTLQSDQYALAATYFKCRTGRNLFTTNVLVDMANFHINETPNLDPLPPPEQAVLRKALAKRPEDRYPSCVEFARALRRAVFPPPPEPKPVAQPGNYTALRMIGVAVACALAVGAVSWWTQTRDKGTPAEKEDRGAKGDEKKDKPPEKKFATYPDYWTAVEAAGVQQIGDRHYDRQLKRTVGDQTLTAFLIYATPGSPSEPFYMLEHKVTVKAFRTAWNAIADATQVQDIRAAEGGLIQELGKERWRFDEDDKRSFDIDGADAMLPVLGVTVPEAILVAEWLGGDLPTFRQWQKAAGLYEEGETDGPAGSVLMPPAGKMGEELFAWRREQCATRNLALGLAGRPLAVDSPRATGDKSRPWRIRQLVSNGQEWLGQVDRTDTLISLRPLPLGPTDAFVVGHGPREAVIDSRKTLLEQPGSEPWTRVDGVYAGFRVVLKPR